MKIFWKYITQFGIREGQDESIRSRVVLINQITFITILLILFGSGNLLLLKAFPSIFILLAGATLLVGGLFINRAGHHNAAATCVLFVIHLEIFYFSSYFGSGSGIAFFYFPAAMCIAFLFDVVKQRFYFITHFVFLVCLISLLLLGNLKLIQGPGFDGDYLRHVLAFDLVISISLILYFIYLVSKTTEQRQRELLQYIEERRIAEDNMKASLKEKETLLAEVHHRVKNNLAVISGLLNLQMHSANNDYTRNVLLDCKNRVSSMALIHEKLYRSQSLAEINLHSYLPDLVKEIRNSFEEYQEQIDVQLTVPDVFLTVSEAIPCGLILNELVTNSFKHAFPDKKNARIAITVRKTENELHITVSDNGKGMQKTIDPKKGETLGLILIQSLADQIGGKYHFSNQNGTQFALTFTPSSIHSNKFT
jgi:two-component sensor histidine kinase